MSMEVLRQAVNAQFIANWTATPVTADRVDFGGNSKKNFTPADGLPWARVAFNVLDNENAQIGADFQRAVGIITVQCYAPQGTGEKLIITLVDDALAVFQNKNFGGVRCFATTPVRIGETGNWYQMNSKTVFQFDVFS